MSKITPKMVQDLRKQTGVGMSKCKDALVEADGDMDQAIHLLRKAGIASAVKKGGRETNEGVIVFAETDQDAYLLEVNAETDFVIQNDRFKEFVQNITKEMSQTKPSSLESFLKEAYSQNPSLTLDEYRAEMVHALGENIQLKRLLKLTKSGDASLGSYSHMGGKIVCIVTLKGSSDVGDLAREVAMHVAAESPEYLFEDEIPKEVKSKEEEIARSQVQNKPPEIMDKIVQGKMKAYYEQVCLVNQKFVKDPSMTVKQFVESEGKKRGKDLSVLSFVRWQVGE